MMLFLLMAATCAVLAALFLVLAYQSRSHEKRFWLFMIMAGLAVVALGANAFSTFRMWEP